MRIGIWMGFMLGLLVVGCGSSASISTGDTGPSTDLGLTPDAPEATVPLDTGSEPDTSAVLDAGTSPDSGPASDLGDAATSCRLNSDCPRGQYCGPTNTCTFDCRANVDCVGPTGTVCDPDLGRCVGADAGMPTDRPLVNDTPDATFDLGLDVADATLPLDVNVMVEVGLDVAFDAGGSDTGGDVPTDLGTDHGAADVAGDVVVCASCPTPAHATPVCSAGACSFTCLPGFGDCDSDRGNGCETDLTTTVTACGVCGHACPTTPHTTASCATSVCHTTCTTGFTDCNGLPTDGCETSTLTDPTNCGTCGHVCTAPTGGSATCPAGTCVLACPSGQSNCSGVCQATGATCSVGVGACARTGTIICASSGTGTTCSATPGTPGTEICNYQDDNCDGRVDDGLTYVDVAAARHAVVGGGVGLWGVAHSADRVAVSWATGLGIPSDQVTVQILDNNASPVGTPVVFGDYQSSTGNAVAWLGDRFVLVGTTRSYDCASPSSCATYALGVNASGSRLFGPSLILTSGPTTLAMVGVGSQFFVPFADASGATRVRSYTASGVATGVERVLLAGGGAVRAAVGPEAIYWAYPLGSDLRMLVTDLTATPLGGPYTLRAGTGAHFDNLGAAVLVQSGTVYVNYLESGTLYVGRWTTTGVALGTPVGVDSDPVGYTAMDTDGTQLFVCNPGGSTPRVARVSLGGTLVQAMTPVLASANYRCGVAATSQGAVVASANNATDHVYWSRFGCP